MHDISVWLRTDSNPANINRARRHTGKDDSIEIDKISSFRQNIIFSLETKIFEAVFNKIKLFCIFQRKYFAKL